MPSISEADSQCKQGDTFCEIRVYEQEVIVVPVLLLMCFLGTLVVLLLLRFCPEKVNRLKPETVRFRPKRSRRDLHGIDAPSGLNALEHEAISLDSRSYSTFSSSCPTGSTSLSDLRQKLPESFNLVSPLQPSFSLESNNSVSLCRAKMDDKYVILRVLKDSASASERQSFLGFASFLSQLNHPFLPAVLGVVSLRAPLVTVMEEMENRDLLSFLWRCRQDHGGQENPCDLTEKNIFVMAGQVASALEYLHSKNILHGKVGARSVLVSHELTAKLWGLGTTYSKKNPGADWSEDLGYKKWQAPEVLARRAATPRSDVWSFGVLLYEMVTLGDAPFPDVKVSELLQFLQRGKTLKRPVNCSNSIYSVIKVCCHWKEQERATVADLIRKLQSGEKSANDKTVLRVPEPINIERYLQEAGYGDYSVL